MTRMGNMARKTRWFDKTSLFTEVINIYSSNKYDVEGHNL
jgi:hypothetical protein